MKNQLITNKKVFIRTFGEPLARDLQTDLTISGRFVRERLVVE
jgi:hypothetical protein